MRRTNIERNREIIKKHKNKASIKDLMDFYNLKRRRIYQILKLSTPKNIAKLHK